jgi:hypothetical protein
MFTLQYNMKSCVLRVLTSSYFNLPQVHTARRWVGAWVTWAVLETKLYIIVLKAVGRLGQVRGSGD